MKNKLLISSALLAAGIVLASCEKTPNGEPGAEAQRPNGSTASEHQQSGGEQAQTPGAPSGEPGTESQRPNGSTISERQQGGGEQAQTPGAPSREPGTESQRPDGSTTSARQQGGGEKAQKRSAQEQGTPQQSSKAAERAGQPPAQGTATINEQQGREGQHEQAVELQNRNADQNQPTGSSAQARDENTKSKEQEAQSVEREEQKPGASSQSLRPLQQGAPEPQQSQAPNEARQAQSAGSQQNAGGAAGGAVNLSRDQIRQAQVILKQKGFDVGDLDGKLGPRTRKALMAYQQQQGLQATGQMDQQTVSALGIGHGSGQNTRSPGATTGQGGAGTP
jgi:putative peptidoglycan binding protein